MKHKKLSEDSTAKSKEIFIDKILSILLEAEKDNNTFKTDPKMSKLMRDLREILQKLNHACTGDNKPSKHLNVCKH